MTAGSHPPWSQPAGCYLKVCKRRHAATTSLRLAPVLQHRGTPTPRGASHRSRRGTLPLAACSSGSLHPHRLSRGCPLLPRAQGTSQSFSLRPASDPSPAPPAPQGPSASAPLPPAGHGAATTEPGLGQQAVRPKGQQTVGSRPRPRASRLRIQLCFHGNAQSRGSTVRSCVALAAAAALCTAKSSCRPRPCQR